MDRLRLSELQVEAIAVAIENVADLEPVVGTVTSSTTRPNGLVVDRVRIPLGVVAMIFESRPNVVTDASALCIKSGNAVILKGGSDANHSNFALFSCVKDGLKKSGLPTDAVQLLSSDRAIVKELLLCDEDIDVVIPRGGEGLIRFVAENSKIPVLKHYKGVCHTYIHESADLERAIAVSVDGKLGRPSACNSTETILIDKNVAQEIVPLLVDKLTSLGCEVRADRNLTKFADNVTVAKNEFGTEYLAPIVNMRIVDDIDHAIRHIHQFGSDHTEAIVTESSEIAQYFVNRVGSSSVMINASTRFADGGELGLGAEIGISTTRLHAYGPMGLEGLTTKRFVIHGTGQVRG